MPQKFINQAKRLTGINPLAYMGVEPITPPQLQVMTTAPTSTDAQNFNLGTLWLVTPAPYQLWLLVKLSGVPINNATWIQLFPSASIALTLQGNVGTAEPTGAGVINVLGAAPVVTTGDNLNTLTISVAGSVATVYDEDVGSATPVAGVLNIVGGTNINTSGAGNTVTINTSAAVADSYVTDAGTAVPVAGVLNVLGAGGVTTTGAGNTVTVVGGGTIAEEFVTDSGTAIPLAGILNIVGASGITTSGAGNTVTINGNGVIPITVVVTITSLQIKALHASPITIVPAQGANTIIVVQTALGYLTYGGTNAFTGGGTVTLFYESSAGTIAIGPSGAPMMNTTQMQATSDQIGGTTFTNLQAVGATVTGPTGVVNQPIVCGNSGADFTGNAANDNTLTITCTYVVYTV